MSYPLIASRIFNTPLLIHPNKLEVILHALKERLDIPVPRPEAAGPDMRKRRMSSTYIDRGIGVADISGTLVHKGSWIGQDESGLVSYEGIAQQVRMLGESDEVRAILLNIASWGGEAAGCFDCAMDLPQLTNGKPLFAIADGMATSGGYALGMGAEEFVATRDARVGSVGVVLTHMDVSKMAEQDGVKVTHIFAGEEKVLGSPWQELSDSDREKLQSDVNETYDLFVELVAFGRNLSPDAVRATEAGVFSGEKAVEMGLVDRAISVREYLDELAGKFNTKRGSEMSGETTETPEVTRELIASEYPAIAESFREEARSEGATAERERIQSVLDQSMPGHEQMVNDLAFDGKTTGPEAAVKILQAEKSAKESRLEQIEKDGEAVAAVPSDDAPVLDSGASVEDQCRHRWEHDPKVREDFSTLESFTAFTKASKTNKIRIAGGEQ